MTVSLADAFARIQGGPPAPVMLIDTCSFLDLFRTDESQTKVPYQPRGTHQEIRVRKRGRSFIQELRNREKIS